MQFTPNEVRSVGINVNLDGSRRTAYQLLSFKDVTPDTIAQLNAAVGDIDSDILAQLARQALYANYIQRQDRDVALLRKDENLQFPADFVFDGLSGLSNELQHKLHQARPENIAQAARIEGMTPAALSLLVAKIRSGQRKAS
jgi:tRNA uridine 5-carboxymethylaminomethyl modification enzyme